ncbi:MAG: ATP-binding protein [Actinoplanes sp.]
MWSRLPVLGDALAAVIVVTVFWVPGTIHAGTWPLVVAGFALALGAGAAMTARRRAPASATVAAAITTLTGMGLGLCDDPMLATAWCLYPLAIALAARPRVPLLLLAGLLAGLAVVTGVPARDPDGLARWLFLAVIALTVSWLLGTMVGRHIAAARESERARVHLAVARDVHDVVGHALGVIGAEAGVIRSLPDAGEAELREALADIETHARNALGEVQTLVRTLRSPAGVDQLQSLISAARAAGARVDARIEVAAPTDGVVGAAVFRIVQESLSNSLRHAAGAPCSVDVHTGGGAIVVRVRDRGPGAAAGGTGFGLRGMRERARLVGGTVTWGNHPGGGFEVAARLPAR